MKRKPFLHQVNVVNAEAMTEDGIRYTAQKKINIVQSDQEKFFLTYAHIVGVIQGFSSISDIKAFYWIMNNLQFNETIISLTRYFKDRMSEDIGLSKSAIEKSIYNLCKCEILIKDTKAQRSAVYHVNPTYAYYGDNKERKKNLKIVLEMKQYNRTDEEERQVQNDMLRISNEYLKGNI